ncbi:putative phage tail protein [Metaclostridioides mangenotii]|uniref:putative phage tail protein n=1 Tax=Metaclostridioides mangenotii TaxID=1540 RepID=UPI00056FCE49|nr:putative phage tail protein [Clostridioides mangenotii]
MLIDKEPLHEQNYVTKKILSTYDKELEILRNIKQDTFNQFFVDTATWGLDYWEKMLCIKTNTKLSYKTRRSNIKGKMRGRGTTTIQVLKSICEAYTKREADIKEHAKEFLIVLDIIINDCDYNTVVELDKFVDQIKPAHLYHKFMMNLISENKLYIGAAALTGEEIAVYPWSIKEIESKGKYNVAIGTAEGNEEITVYPREVI